jgi:hypothetical protein
MRMMAQRANAAETKDSANRQRALARPPLLGNQALLRQLSAPRIQAKLEIGPVNDPLEREAEAMASQVMRMPDPARGVGLSLVQVSRKCAACAQDETGAGVQCNYAAPEMEGDEAPAMVHDALRSAGRPLEPSARAFFEPRFGQELGAVRVHDDSAAGTSARSVGAVAYTVGAHVVFGTGQFEPGTASGRHLIAHELAHVVQQTGGAQGGAPISVQRDTTSGTGGTGGTGGVPAAPSAAEGRPLTSAERDVASFIFGPALNLDPIVIKESAVMTVGGYIRTLPDTIYIPPGYKIDLSLLMHELTHCAQYQHGVSRVVTAATAIEAHYDYGGEAGLLEAIKTKKCFDHFNTEQQADIVRDYYLHEAGGGTTYPWSVFIDQVRAQGACIWPATPTTPAPAPPPKGAA